MLEKLGYMEKFFKYNLEMKNILFNTMPKETDKYSKETIMEYSDKLFKALNDIEYYINVILDNFEFLENERSYFNNLIKVLKDELIKCGYNYDKLTKFYKVCFSNMREELVNKVGNEIKGGGYLGGVSLNEAKSLNEVIHIVHQTILNDENNYRNLPIISKKQNFEGNDVTLYGRENEISKLVFNSIPYSLSSDYVEIMSLNNDKVVLMIRDVGHALSIEIEKENDKYYVRYFIPKICNIHMINNLKGVKKVKVGDTYTVGVFESTLEKLPFELVDFISKVPTDIDMYKEGGIFYESEIIQRKV